MQLLIPGHWYVAGLAEGFRLPAGCWMARPACRLSEASDATAGSTLLLSTDPSPSARCERQQENLADD